MADQDHLTRVWQIIERVGVCMLTTHFPSGFRARPVEPRLDRAAGLIWVVTDLRSEKEHEIETEHDVGLTFVDTTENAYLSITARAEVRCDHARAAEIWRYADNLWWKGPDDPNVCVLLITPLTAELWDGPASKAVAAFEFVKARLTGAKPNLGENRKVTVDHAENQECPMLDHAGFPVSDYKRSKAFYEKALAPLGYVLVMEVPQTENDTPAAGFGIDPKPDFWIGGEGGLNRPVHIAIAAKDRAAVDAFYRAAIAAGGKDNGAPGLRPHYHPNYYAAFVFDLDGHNIEAVCHSPA